MILQSDHEHVIADSCNESMNDEWKYIQKCTFTNWCNTILVSHNITISDLYVDVCDGIVLVKLYENISDRKIHRYIKNPKVISHKLENVSLVMKEMHKDGVKFVNIDPLDICQGNSKLILAFIWHMILYYQIGCFTLISDSFHSETSQTKNPIETTFQKQKSIIQSQPKPIKQLPNPRSLILKLLNFFIPQNKSINLTTDWNTGKLLAALVETLSPGSCPSFSTWNEKNLLLNVTTALCLAEVHLGIPVLIEPHHMVTKNIDELSMLTYLSSFTKDGGVIEKYLVNKISEKFPCLVPIISNMTTDWNTGVALCKLVKAYDENSLEKGFFDDFHNLNIESIEYKEKCISNIKYALVEVKQLFGIEWMMEPELMASTSVPALAIMSFVCELVNIEPKRIEKNVTKVDHLCLNIMSDSDEMIIGKPVKFIVGSNDGEIDKDDFDAKITFISNQDQSLTLHELKKQNKSKYVVSLEFTPLEATNYHINVQYQGEIIPGSPLNINITAPPLKYSDVVIEGFDNTSICVGESLMMLIRLKRVLKQVNCVIEEITTKHRKRCDIVKVSNQIFRITCKMDLPGIYNVLLTSEDDSEIILKEIECHLPTNERIKLKTPKVLYGHVGEEVSFAFDATDVGQGTLDVKINPINTSIKYNIENIKIKEVAGEWTVLFKMPHHHHITWSVDLYWNRNLISPDCITIHTYRSDTVKVSGIGYQEYVLTNTQNTVQVYLGDCGNVSQISAILQSKFNSLSQKLLHFKLIERNFYECTYWLTNVGSFHFKLYLNGKEVELKRKSMEVIDLDQLEYDIISGDIVGIGRKIDVKVIIPYSAGNGDLFYAMEGPNGPMKVLVESVVKKNKCEIYVLSSTPNSSGKHKLILNYGGMNIPGFPKIFEITSVKPIDLSNIIVDTEQLKVAIYGRENEFTVSIGNNISNESLFGYFTYNNDIEEEKMKIDFISPNDHKDDKKYVARYFVNKLSPITMRLYFADIELEQSPISIPVVDIMKISVLSQSNIPSDVVVGQRYLIDLAIPYKNIIECINASITSPSGRVSNPEVREYDYQTVPQNLSIIGGSIYQIEFCPKQLGKYEVHISVMNHSLVGFPRIFTAHEPEPIEEKNVIINIDKNREYNIGNLISIIVDGRTASSGTITATVFDSNNLPIDISVCPVLSKFLKQKGDSAQIYQLNFNLETPGLHYLNVFWNNKKVVGCPIVLKAITSLPDVCLRNGIICDGIAGEPIHIYLDNVHTSVDNIRCHCMNSARMPLKSIIKACSSADDSYIITLEPTSSGMHQVEINVAGKSIPGSPFYFKIIYKINAKNVKIYGPGTVSGVIDSNKGVIYAKTDTAGSGLMQVAVQGPKEGFQLTINDPVDEYYEQTSSIVQMDYRPQTSGLYVVNILWSGEHVPGSPFFVYNCQNEEELKEIQDGNIPSNYLTTNTSCIKDSYVY